MEGGARSNSGNRIRWTLLPRRGRVRADDEKVYVRDCWLTPEWKFLRAIINPIGSYEGASRGEALRVWRGSVEAAGGAAR